MSLALGLWGLIRSARLIMCSWLCLRAERIEARAFYGTLLGMTEVPKPAELAKRGGCWFACGPVQIHLGVEADFRAARKAHPALRCFDYHGLVSRLRAAGVEVTDDASIPGVRRCHIADPFGNRIELISE